MSNNKNWIPFAISATDYARPEVQDNFATIVCEMFGMPVNDACKAKASELVPMTPVSNVVGNPAYNVEAGSDWYISDDSIRNILGDNIAQAQAKLDAMKLKPKQGDPLIGDITAFGGEWFKEWGVVTQDAQDV